MSSSGSRRMNNGSMSSETPPPPPPSPSPLSSPSSISSSSSVSSIFPNDKSANRMPLYMSAHVGKKIVKKGSKLMVMLTDHIKKHIIPATPADALQYISTIRSDVLRFVKSTFEPKNYENMGLKRIQEEFDELTDEEILNKMKGNIDSELTKYNYEVNEEQKILMPLLKGVIKKLTEITTKTVTVKNQIEKLQKWKKMIITSNIDTFIRNGMIVLKQAKTLGVFSTMYDKYKTQIIEIKSILKSLNSNISAIFTPQATVEDSVFLDRVTEFTVFLQKQIIKLDKLLSISNEKYKKSITRRNAEIRFRKRKSFGVKFSRKNRK